MSPEDKIEFKDILENAPSVVNSRNSRIDLCTTQSCVLRSFKHFRPCLRCFLCSLNHTFGWNVADWVWCLLQNHKNSFVEKKKFRDTETSKTVQRYVRKGI